MSVQSPKPPAPARTPGDKTRSFLLYAFGISILLHFIVLPFFGLKHQDSEKDKVEKVSVSKKIKVVVPTPPPPTPTPPPPTPPPKQTPPPVKQTNPPPQPKIKLNVPKSTKHTGPSTEHAYVAPKTGSEDADPSGTEASGKPAPPGPAATAAPTPEPTATPTPKPQCANPNADAAMKGSAVEPDYPDIAREQGATGVTQVEVTLDANGNVTDATVHKSSGNQALDQAAIKAARATAYVPDIVNCVKTAGSYIFRAEFTGQ